MKESPNKDNPRADVVAVVEELLDLFNEAEAAGGSVIELDDNCIELRSAVGSTFHARVLNAARYLKINDRH
ncbi:hypothetical protein [Bradyrhizobium ottawaense]|uniref:hypothetical protein n=1 Tax=Bradyrhizobium ottawaense TaxID=931866 RepID=UPI0011777CD8|nr:hypothetical protein [Bradyrhizobium ottawaense]